MWISKPSASFSSYVRTSYSVSNDRAHITDISLVVIGNCLLVSQFSEGIDDQTGKHVQENQVDRQEESEIVKEPYVVESPMFFIVAGIGHDIADSSIGSRTLR